MSPHADIQCERCEPQRAGRQLSSIAAEPAKLDFAGTDLMPSANGEAKVNSKRGSIEVDAEFGNLREADDFRQ